MPSIASKKKPITDPAVVMLAKEKYEDELLFEKHHFLMQAENIVGELVERYIASKCYATDNWAFCPKMAVQTTDFIRENEDGSFYFLNIKNRWNSENSSSKKTRELRGVDMWYRIKSNGDTNWEQFPDDSLQLSEEEFIKFCSSHMENTS
ncbi:MAG: SinI family restriction endonuclease [Bacteroidetes bacterium]|nr:MAG: SinI family restriction endonuclease [Bacteroidota bacterium]